MEGAEPAERVGGASTLETAEGCVFFKIFMNEINKRRLLKSYPGTSCFHLGVSSSSPKRESPAFLRNAAEQLQLVAKAQPRQAATRGDADVCVSHAVGNSNGKNRPHFAHRRRK